MNLFKKTILAGCMATLGLLAAPAANAIPTNVQLNTDGIAGYDVVGINQFDWQSSGDLGITNALPGGGSTAGGVNRTTFSAWAANAVVGDTVTFTINAQARLNDLLSSGGTGIAPANLDRNGAVNGCSLNVTCVGTPFEITSALTGIETARLLAPGVLQFISITGTYKYYFDTNPNSNVGTGAGFIDGVNFLTGNLVATGGTFTFGVGGSSILTNSVTSYLPFYIETDPLTNQPLIGTTFDTLLTLSTTGQASVGPGGVIGLAPYTLLLADLVFKADANSKFAGTAVPEPSTALLVGITLLGLGLSTRRRGT